MRRQGCSTRSGYVMSCCVLALAGMTLWGQALTKPAASLGFHEPLPRDFADHHGFTRIFDGVNLKEWEGDPSVWHVQDGAIVGLSTPEKPVSNAYIWRKNLLTKNFDLKLEIKCEIVGGSGIQCCSQTGLPWNRSLHLGEKPRNLDWFMTGPQADFWFPLNPSAAEYSGQVYSENTKLGIVAWRGEVVEMGPDQEPMLIGNLQDREALGGYIHTNDWNQYEIIARNGVMMHIINGHLMAVLIDDDPKSSNNAAGKIGIELEGTPAKVSVREVWIKPLD